MKDLTIRSISGLLYAALIISAALTSDIIFITVIFIFSSLALYEFQKLIQHKSPVPFILFGVIVYQFYYLKINPYLHLTLISLCIGINFLLSYLLLSQKKNKSFTIAKKRINNLLFSSLRIFYYCNLLSWLIVRKRNFNKHVSSYMGK